MYESKHKLDILIQVIGEKNGSSPPEKHDEDQVDEGKQEDFVCTGDGNQEPKYWNISSRTKFVNGKVVDKALAESGDSTQLKQMIYEWRYKVDVLEIQVDDFATQQEEVVSQQK